MMQRNLKAKRQKYKLAETVVYILLLNVYRIICFANNNKDNYYIVKKYKKEKKF